MGRPAVFNGLQYHTDPDNGGGKIDLERTLLRWPHILIFPLLPGEERMQFESLRRGEISPDLEDQEPDQSE